MDHRIASAGSVGARPRPRILAQAAAVAAIAESLAALLLRYGLVLVIAWIGAMKFTAYEAGGIQPMVSNSPLLSWVYDFLSVQGFSSALGTIELIIAGLIALRPWSPRAAVVGGALAAGMFLTTLSFLFTTPGWEPALGGFPALSAMPGQFLLKDVVLLGAALWSAGEAARAAASPIEGR